MSTQATGSDRRNLDIGVFLPIAQNGFVFSKNVPAYGDYPSNLAIAKKAEEIGLDFVFAMAKWRGFGGETNMWDGSVESFALMTALAAETERVRLIATVNPLLFHPALLAKMSATADQAANGRLGLNIITGSNLKEYTQMGVVPEGYDQNRYAYAEEWVKVLKRLWSEERVTHDGEYFHLDDCISDPKPARRPALVCAATSEEGLRFVARETDISFVSGGTKQQMVENAQRAKAAAAREGTTIKTAVAVNVVQGDDLADAKAYARYLTEGADEEALANTGFLASRLRPDAQVEGVDSRIFFALPLIGGATEIADDLIDLVESGDIDAVQLAFPDFERGLPLFEAGILPILRERFIQGEAAAFG